MPLRLRLLRRRTVVHLFEVPLDQADRNLNRLQILVTRKGAMELLTCSLHPLLDAAYVLL